MKIAISVSDELHARVDEAAAQLGLNRSQLYARAAEQFLATHTEDPVTEALNRFAHADFDGTAGHASGLALIKSGHWEW